MFRKQIEGVINLSFPIIILYNISPAFLLTISGQIFCSCAVGIYLYVMHYNQLQSLQKGLQFSPSASHQEFFNNIMEACQVDPSSVILKYAYIPEGIALTASNTIVIDPILWHGLSDDSQAVKVEEIFKVHIEPGLTDAQKAKIVDIKQLLTPESQRFIFKHELGHVVRHFSFVKLLVIFFVGFLATYSGVVTAMIALQIHGLFAILVGMLVGGCMDLLLTYTSNIVWKLQEEKAADYFAVQYSSDEDVRAAALFFENYQHVIDRYKSSRSFIANLPQAVLSGHQHGSARSAYLLQLLSKK